MIKVLVVEDDRDIQRLLRYNLEKEGYGVASASNGEEAVAVYRREQPALLVLDLMLPKVSGLEVCRMIRSEDKHVPILMLTAKSTEVDKIVGLEMGADDYVTKPFSVREVLTRIKTLLRRAGQDDGPSHPMAAGHLHMDPEKYELRLGGKPVDLTSKEFELLKILWAARGKALTREDILERVWGYEKAADIDTRTVDQHVARLRNKLGPEKKRIATVKNVGYRFLQN
ncbi:MAG: response regulator transcription factor [Elusimicrobia bacterium]|nr:response regulator transcription factor [Elusimicrobiota bacterium]